MDLQGEEIPAHQTGRRLRHHSLRPYAVEQFLHPDSKMQFGWSVAGESGWHWCRVVRRNGAVWRITHKGRCSAEEEFQLNELHLYGDIVMQRENVSRGRHAWFLPRRSGADE